MKFIVCLIVFVVFLSIMFGVVGGEDYAISFYNLGALNHKCSGAIFCGDEDSAVECSPFEDGICPSHYGDWDSCDLNNVGERCTPCDPNCGDCGQRVEIDVSNVQYTGEDVTVPIEVHAYGYPIDGGINTFRIRRVLGDGEYEYIVMEGDADCEGEFPNTVCSYSTDMAQINEEPCKLYTFETRFQYGGGFLYSDYVGDSGIVSPYIEITSPSNEDILEGKIDIISQVTCNAEENSIVGVVGYEICDGEDCDLITATYHQDYSDGEFIYPDFDTTQYFNKDYTLNAGVAGGNGDTYDIEYSYDSIDITLDNPPGSNYQGSTLLNLFLVKIKTWI